MALEIPILIKGGTEAQRVANAGTTGAREPNFSSGDARRFYVGDQIVGWPIAEATVALSAAGNTDLVLTSGYPVHLCKVTVAAGAGLYTAKLVLPAAESGGVDARDGAIYELLFEFAASVNGTVEVRNEAAGGTLLWSKVLPEAVARKFLARFYRLGGDWVHAGTTEIF